MGSVENEALSVAVRDITCLRNQFQTHCSAFQKKIQLQVSVVQGANTTNWTENKSKLSSALNHVINLDLSTQKTAREQLKQGLGQVNFAFYVKLNDESFRYGILYPTFDDTFWSLRLFRQKPCLNTKVQKNVGIQETVESVAATEPTEVSPTQLKTNTDSQQIKSPIQKLSALSISQNQDSVLKNIDPMQFLMDRYYSTLYSESMLVEHFVKSSIPKMHILTRNTIQLSKDSLSNLVIDSLDKLDFRYSSNIDEKTPTSEFTNTWFAHLITADEKKYRTDAVSQLTQSEQLTFTESESLKQLLERLKLKDLKLQLLLNLELLKILKSESKSAVDSVKQKPTLPKQSSEPVKTYTKNLIGKKKKRLIPTLLGTVLPTTLDFDVDLRTESSTSKDYTVDSIYRLVKGLFDKLCINDAIMGLDYKHASSSWGFLSNIIIPFYDKYHHRLLSELAVNSRGPAFILKLKNKREKKEREERHQLKKQEKEKLKADRKPIASNIDLSKLKLKRSHSSFSTTSKIDLSRKTFSMGLSTTESSIFPSSDALLTSDDIVEQPISLLTTSSPGGFMNSRKRKLVTAKRNSTTEKLMKLKEQEAAEKASTLLPNTQLQQPFEPVEVFYNNQVIEATPRKMTKSYSVFESPRQVILESSPLKMRKTISSPFEIRKRPSSPVKISLIPEIAETPRLERVQVRPGVFEIGSSPMKNDQLFKNSQQIVMSSPVANMKSASSIDKGSTKRKLNFD